MKPSDRVAGWTAPTSKLPSGRTTEIKDGVSAELRKSASEGLRLLRREDPFVVAPEDPSATLAELEPATLGWTTLTVVRTFREDHRGRARLAAESDELAKHGYVQTSYIDTKGQVKTKSLLLTGGLGAAINYARGTGGLHEASTRAVTFTKRVEASSVPAQQLRDLAGLRDDGLITEPEYQAKKADILKRL